MHLTPRHFARRKPPSQSTVTQTETAHEKPSGPSQDRLGLVLECLRDALSDWALTTHYRGLLERLADDGLVHPASLVLLPSIEPHSISQDEIRLCLQLPQAPAYFRPCPDNVRLGRIPPINPTSLSTLNDDYWSQRIYYVENFPPDIKDLSRLQSFLEATLRTPVLHARFPKLFDATMPTNVHRKSLTDPSEADKPRSIRLPMGDGPCKGFAFFVTRDVVEYSKTGSLADHQLPAQEDSGRAVTLIPISRWNRLAQTYLNCQRRLSDMHESTITDVPSVGTRQRHRQGVFSTMPPQDGQPALTQEAEAYPRGCVVFTKGINTSSKKKHLRTILESIISVCSGKLEYLEYKPNLDSCHARFSSSEAPTVVSDYFAAHRLTQDASRLDHLMNYDDAGPESTRIQAEVLTAEREQVFWEGVQRHIHRNKNSAPFVRKASGHLPATERVNKHMRFD